PGAQGRPRACRRPRLRRQEPPAVAVGRARDAADRPSWHASCLARRTHALGCARASRTTLPGATHAPRRPRTGTRARPETATAQGVQTVRSGTLAGSTGRPSSADAHAADAAARTVSTV